MDIGSFPEFFFEEYNIPKQECTLEHREVLEEIIISMLFPNGVIECEGEQHQTYKNYCIQYDVDQWWGAYAMEVVKVNNKYYYDIAFRGEGNSQTYALLGLLIEMKKIFNKEQIQEIRNVFSSKDGNECLK